MTILGRGLSWIGAGIVALAMLVALWLTASVLYLVTMGALILLIGALLAGCTQAITMQHADGRTANCGGLAFDSVRAPMAPQREAQCIQDFKEQGFVRQP